MQYCSLQHQTLLLSPVTSTTGYCFCFCSIPSFFLQLFLHWSPALPGGSDGKASAYNAGDPGLIPGSRRSSGEGNGNPLQYSCLENPWTEEIGWLLSLGSQRVGQNWATSLSTSLLSTYWHGEFIFLCPIFLPFHTVHGVLKARILKWFAIPFSSGPHSVRPLHHDPAVLGGSTLHGLVSSMAQEQQLCGVATAKRRYPTSKVRSSGSALMEQWKDNLYPR